MLDIEGSTVRDRLSKYGFSATMDSIVAGADYHKAEVFRELDEQFSIYGISVPALIVENDLIGTRLDSTNNIDVDDLPEGRHDYTGDRVFDIWLTICLQSLIKALGFVAAKTDTDVDDFIRCTRVRVYISTSPGFMYCGMFDHMIGKLCAEVFGSGTEPASTTIGVTSLPGGLPLMIDATFQVSGK